MIKSSIGKSPDGPIAVLVSGGADSALLLYYLMSQHKDTIHIYTLSPENKGGKNAKLVPDIIKWCSERTKNTNYTHTTKTVPEQTSPVLFNEVEQWLTSGKISGLYGGVTANPPADVLNGFKTTHNQSENRDPLIHRPEYFNSMYFPFHNIDKQKIAEQYKEYDLMDLFDLTSSCEWMAPGTHRPGIDPEKEHCGHCWWCEERIWGFGRL